MFQAVLTSVMEEYVQLISNLEWVLFGAKGEQTTQTNMSHKKKDG